MDYFESIAKQYEPLIHKVMNNLNIYTNKDEFYQIGLIALWQAHERFDKTKGEFVNYAYSYVKGRMMSELTRINRHNDLLVYPDEQFWDIIKDDDANKSVLELETLLSHCDILSKRERQWVVYHFYYGLEQSQIAPLEGVTTHAVQGWRRGALNKLRKK